MRTREKSKAQLMRQLDNQETLIQKGNEAITQMTDLRKELAEKEQRIDHLLHEVRTWKEAFLSMQARMKQMRKNFYQQAALAGELADNAYATVAPTNTADEAR